MASDDRSHYACAADGCGARLRALGRLRHRAAPVARDVGGHVRSRALRRDSIYTAELRERGVAWELTLEGASPPISAQVNRVSERDAESRAQHDGRGVRAVDAHHLIARVESTGNT